MMRWAIVVVLLIAATRGARGADAFGWRDGCPAGNVQSAADWAAPAKLPDPYSGTDPRSIGTAPELDSALVPTRLLLAPLEFAHFSSSGAGGPTEVNRLRMAGAKVQIDARLFVTAAYAIGASLSTAYFGVLSGDSSSDGQPTPTPRQLGNVVLGLSGQHYWTSSSNVPEGEELGAASATESAPVIAGLRKGVAVRVAMVPVPNRDAPAGATTIFQRTAFDGLLFDPHRLIDVSFETRVEGVGCYAPFLHLRLRWMLGHEVSGQHWMILAPETLAAGLTVAPGMTVMLEYGLLFVSTTGPMADALFDTNRVHRFRFGTEFAGKRWSAGVHLDGYLGSKLYEGTAFELYMSFAPFGIGR